MSEQTLEDMIRNNEPVIEELHDEDTWEDFYDANKKKVDHMIQSGEETYPNGHFLEFCDICKKSFVIAETQLFCPKCGYPIIREDEDGNLSHER